MELLLAEEIRRQRSREGFALVLLDFSWISPKPMSKILQT
jgi:hypothetical protein